MQAGIRSNSGAVTLADDAITAAKIAADAIGASEIAANAIGAAEIADGAIDANTFAAGAITAAAIATDAIDADALAASALAEINAEVDGALNTQVPSSPTAGSLNDILSKTTGNTYSRSTDSLEAIADSIASLTTGAYMKRSAQSGSLLMTGSEQTLYELAPGTVAEVGGGSINIPASAGATFTARIYIKNKSGGSYINVTPTNLTAVENSYLVFANSFDNTANNKRGFIPRFTQYGVKVTLEQTGVGAGYVTVDHEWFDTIGI